MLDPLAGTLPQPPPAPAPHGSRPPGATSFGPTPAPPPLLVWPLACTCLRNCINPCPRNPLCPYLHLPLFIHLSEPSSAEPGSCPAQGRPWVGDLHDRGLHRLMLALHSPCSPPAPPCHACLHAMTTLLLDLAAARSGTAQGNRCPALSHGWPLQSAQSLSFHGTLISTMGGCAGGGQLRVRLEKADVSHYKKAVERPLIQVSLLDPQGRAVEAPLSTPPCTFDAATGHIVSSHTISLRTKAENVPEGTVALRLSLCA